jgi:hypothetical protein
MQRIVARPVPKKRTLKRTRARTAPERLATVGTACVRACVRACVKCMCALRALLIHAWVCTHLWLCARSCVRQACALLNSADLFTEAELVHEMLTERVSMRVFAYLQLWACPCFRLSVSLSVRLSVCLCGSIGVYAFVCLPCANARVCYSFVRSA